MNKVHKERLLKLADFLENTVPRKHFDLECFTYDNDMCNTDIFGGNDSDEEYKILLGKLNEIKKDFQPHKCGAVACAIGWMPAVFPRSFMWNKTASVILRRDKDEIWPESDFEAVDDFLGIDGDQVSQLFTTDFYPLGRRGPKSVARKIRGFVNTGRLSEKTYD